MKWHSAFGIRHSGFLILLAAVFVLAGPCYAQNHRKGDMFKEQGWDMSRPSVPSDAEHGHDLFKPVPPMLGPGDAFSHAHPDYDFGTTDMFPKRLPEVPEDALFDYPKR
jgi:hypothetical protein